MTPLIIIQARLNSTRLPGKVLMPIKGKALISYLTETMDLWEDCVLATPDGELSGFCNQSIIVGGDENDVAGRFQSVLQEGQDIGGPFDTFVRLCGDSPLIDSALVSSALTLYEPPYLEIVSPVGCVEVCDTTTFLAGLPNMSPHEREHVTMLLRPLGRTIHVGRGPRLVVDTAEDFERVKRVIEKMDRPHTEYGWRECCALLS